ncbi:baeRF3 domain-containing protein [Leucobacter sp. HY1908]
MTHTSQGIVDALDFDIVFRRGAEAGPKLTLTVPTDVTGAQANIGALTLKNQVRDARAHLKSAGVSEADAASMLAPVAEIAADTSYWRLQSRGLIIFVAEGFCHAVRIPIAVHESLTVADSFNMLPLAPVLASDRKTYILALAKGAVRLFDATRNTVEELPLENIPASFDEVVEELPERTIDVRSAGPGANAPYSNGHTGDLQQLLIEKYIHAVGKAVGARLGTARSQPLVLAAVAEYLPLFKQACDYPAIFGEAIAGNPEHALPDDLRSAAWHLLRDNDRAHEAEEQDRARSLAHNGKGAFDLVEIAQAAGEGRVDTLYLPRDDARIADPVLRAHANRALITTLASSGTLRTLSAPDGDGLATFRY